VIDQQTHNIKYKFQFKKRLVLLVGNIGTGKSTLIKKQYQGRYAVVSRDHIRYNIGNGDYVFLTSIERAIYETSRTLLEELLHTGINIVIDETNCRPSIRAGYARLGKQYGYNVTAIVLPKISKEESLKRRMKSPHGVFNKVAWSKVWDLFDSIYTEPTKEEGFDRIIKSKPIKK